MTTTEKLTDVIPLNKDLLLCDSSLKIPFADYSLTHAADNVKVIIEEGVPTLVQLQVDYTSLSSSIPYPQFEKDFFITYWLSLTDTVDYPL